MTDKELFRTALTYVKKNYSYENLMDGDALYNATQEEKNVCGDYFELIRDNGLTWAYKRLEEI